MVDRRMVIRAALAVTIAPVLATHGVSAQSLGGRITPPTGPMLYTRRLVRGLPGGAQISVSRDFRVQFTSMDPGYRIDGEQVSAQVQAPANLARFAELEEQRVERGIFPLFVDGGGYILGGEDAVASAEVTAAFAAVWERIRSNYYDSQSRAERDRRTGLMQTARREVTTDLGGDTRHTLEEFSLSAL